MTAAEESASAAARPTSYLSHRQILVVLSGLMTGMFLASLDQNIVGTALPRIVSDLGGLNQLSWVVTVYLLTATASTPLWGKISDLYGRRPMFQAAIVIFVLGSVVVALAGSMAALITGRAVQGLGAGGLVALALSIIGDVIPPRERGRYQGYLSVVFGTSSVAGPLLGGWFAAGPGWRWIFWINVPIGIAALVITSLALKMPKIRREHKIDYVGAALIISAVSSILLYTAWAGPDQGWDDPHALGLLAGGLGLTAILIFVESRAAEPIIPLRLFRNRVFTPSVTFAALMGVPLFSGIIFVPVYFQVVQGMTPTRSGLALLPLVTGIFATSVGSGHLMTRTGRYKAFPITGAGVVAVALLLLSTLSETTPYWQVAIYICALGIGLGMTLQVITTMVQNAVEQRDMGSATSSVSFFRSIGGALGIAFFGAVLTSRLGHHLASSEAASALSDGFTETQIANNVQIIQDLPMRTKEVVVGAWVDSLNDAFLVALPFVVVAFILAWSIPELRLKTSDDATDRP